MCRMKKWLTGEKINCRENRSGFVRDEVGQCMMTRDIVTQINATKVKTG